jgi:uncharacterized membrane protein YfcA
VIDFIDLARDLALFTASGVSNAINAVAGGGQIIAFPVAMAVGMTPIVANATNSASLFPGALATAWSFRREIYVKKATIALLAGPSIVGALLGAVILRNTEARTFANLVPWLLLAATLLILVQERFGKYFQKTFGGRSRPLLAAATQFAISVYGGFFGVGMGILMLATLSLAGPMELHDRVAVKSVLGASINIAASASFLSYGMINLPAAVVMIIGAIIGGSMGGLLARRASPALLRRVIVFIGLSLCMTLVLKRFMA